MKIPTTYVSGRHAAASPACSADLLSADRLRTAQWTEMSRFGAAAATFDKSIVVSLPGTGVVASDVVGILGIRSWSPPV